MADNRRSPKQGCWDLNPGCGDGPCPSVCPAYRAKKSCWEFDWASVAKGCTPEGKEHWYGFFKSHCVDRACSVYAQHPEALDKVREIFNDPWKPKSDKNVQNQAEEQAYRYHINVRADGASTSGKMTIDESFVLYEHTDTFERPVPSLAEFIDPEEDAADGYGKKF